MKVQEYTSTGKRSKNRFPVAEMKLISRGLKTEPDGPNSVTSVTVAYGDKIVTFTAEQIEKLNEWKENK